MKDLGKLEWLFTVERLAPTWPWWYKAVRMMFPQTLSNVFRDVESSEP